MTFFLNHFTVEPGRPSSKWERTPDGFLRCRARVLAERVMPYGRSELNFVPEGVAGDVVQMLVTRDSMGAAEAIRSLEGASITIGDHQWLTPDTVKEYAKGSVAGTPVLDGPYLVCDLMVTDPEAISRIESRECSEISAAYLAETEFAPGEWDGVPYDAKQVQLRFNHIAVIPEGHGRAGQDVRILNKPQPSGEGTGNPTTKGAEPMVKIKLLNGKYVNVDEEAAAEIEASQTESTVSLDKAMADLEEKNGELAEIQAEADELKGELSVYKEKLDELLEGEQLEQMAAGMAEEQGEAQEVLENADLEEDKEEEIKNTAKKLFGQKLRVHVLNSLGVDTSYMSDEAVRGAYRAQVQLRNTKLPGKKVAGAKIFNAASGKYSEQPAQRTALQRLGLMK